MDKKTVLLMILDGWGKSKIKKGNAIHLANTKVLDLLEKDYLSTSLIAHGRKVGLPLNQSGNSEAGHMNISSGFIVNQEIISINNAIKENTFFKNTAFIEAIKHAKKHKSKVHLIGLLSNGQSAHACPGHLFSLLKLLKQKNLKKVFLHVFTDGRDSPRYAAIKLITKLKPDKELVARYSSHYDEWKNFLPNFY